MEKNQELAFGTTLSLEFDWNNFTSENFLREKNQDMVLNNLAMVVYSRATFIKVSSMVLVIWVSLMN